MTFKNVFPFENYVLTTRLSVDEVLKRVTDNIQSEQGFSFSTFSRNYTKPYTGQISGTTFTMSRNINYRNSFLLKEKVKIQKRFLARLLESVDP